jgi:hypothetical protein
VTAPSSLEKTDWARVALELGGFGGWITFAELVDRLDELSSTGGVYLVYREDGQPRFQASDPGGRFKGRDPSIPDESLRANWVDDADVVYIGKADNLRRRLREFARFGEGVPIGHWGGRLIWQLEGSDKLLVAWRETSGRVPREVEAELIAAFKTTWGKPPFANEPHRLGR